MKHIICFCLYRVLLPLVLLTAVVFRFNAFSFIYLILLFVSPLLPGPSAANVASGHTGRYLKAIIGLSIIIALGQISFQGAMFGLGIYQQYDYCHWDGRLYALIGFHRLDRIKVLDAIRLVGLDYCVILTAVATLVVCEKFYLEEQRSPEENQNLQEAPRCHVRQRKKPKKDDFIIALCEFLELVFMAGAAIFLPSLTAAVYFLIFLAVCTWLACDRTLGRGYLFSKFPAIIYCALHFSALYLYQFDYVQEYIPKGSLYTRLLGLTSMVHIDCGQPRTLVFEKESWTKFVNPFFVLSLYWLLAVTTRLRFHADVLEENYKNDGVITRGDSFRSSQQSSGSVIRQRRHQRRSTIALLNDDHTAHSYKAVDATPQKDTLAIDPNGSVIWRSESECHDGSTAAAPCDEATTVTSGATSKYRRVLSPLVTLGKFIAKGSYIAMLIIMMTWSITYHSWLTFVLLLWSCILWMTPNSRRACLRWSPAIVAYAEALLLLQYIYSLDLYDNELPRQIENVNLAQIGLVKYWDMSYQPLAIKILYTVMFWITLRQYMEERHRINQRDIAEGVMMEPFNISYGTSQPGYPRPDLHRQMSVATSGATAPNPYIRWIADTVYHLLAKFWIWIVACMLMVISLGDENQKVVVYRIVYMFLFLLFILTFQFSYQLWRRVMYGFWLTVIVFSMLVLILIYTYQFEKFPKYWDRLGISEEIQSDLGLEVYKSDPGTLFIKLLIPTFFLIITIIQLHYFHKEFLNISDINYRSSEHLADQATQVTSTSIPTESTPAIVEPNPENKVSSAGASVPASPIAKVAEIKDDDKDNSTQVEKEYKAFKECAKIAFGKAEVVFQYVSEFVWRLLEIHIIKIVLFSVMCLAVYDVCAVHFLFVMFVAIALPFKALQPFLSHCCSIWTAILLLSKMIYQLQVVDRYGWKVNCTNETGWFTYGDNEYPFNETIDNREWIGFKKTKYLADYCKGYIGLVLVLTIQAVVKIRQKVLRYQFNEPEPKPGIIFPDSTRAKADDNITECLKYFCNYFFYKFGLEFSFVTIVACAGVRLDAFSMLSVLWLLIMFLMRRHTISKIWPVFIAVQTVLLTVQYIMCVGIPPGLCLAYPWTKSLKKQMQIWFFLPDFINPPSSYKILVDFFQVLFACCQLHVFKIENGPIAEMYEGGSNKEIVYDEDMASSPNPIPDFVTYKKSYLDMLKVFAFFAFYWLTLAIVFLAGTTRVNLFAMGYVIGCFFFLWNGNEFYLKPIKDLLKWWNSLLTYTVIVILLKIPLQLVGCVYVSDIANSCCWVLQLFGIACIKKLGFGLTKSYKDDIKSATTCELPDDETGLLWDGICFAFLLLQKRLFCSYYFKHLVNEVRAQQVLASRGAELINEIQMREVQEQQAAEKEIMQKIKRKMDHIKAYQQKVRGGDNIEPDTHFQAIRSGDYYMFDEYFDEEIDLELSTSHRREIEDENTAEVRQRGVTALISKTIKRNLINTLEDVRRESGEADDIGESSQQSAIISADRSPISRSTSRTSQRFLSRQTSRRSDTAPSISSQLTSVPVTTTVPSYTDESQDTVQAAIPEEEEEMEDNLIENKQADTFVEKIKQSLDFAKVFIESLLISGTAKLNAVSKDYRFVAYHLANEKTVLKQKYIIGGEFEVKAAEADLRSRELSSILPEIRTETKSSTLKSKMDYSGSMEVIDERSYEDDPEFKKSHPAYIRFIVACYYAAISRSELLCYMVIIGNQMKSSSILSLPLPLMAFLWGTLSVPRPTKSFWITVITYTEAIVVIKYMFRFNFIPWLTSNRTDPFYLPRIFGVVTRDEYATLDLALLLVVFFHRFMLKSLGLWKDSDRSSSTVLSVATTPETLVNEDGATGVMSATEPSIMKAVDEGECKCEAEQTVEDDEHLESERCEQEDNNKQEADIYIILGEFLKPMKSFYRHLLYPEYRVTVDVYAYMFFCDFINFLIVVFGYWAFGTAGSEEGVTSYFEENKVPVPFLIMLAAQFALIVIDRALYLRKYILGKLLFQIVLVFLVHLWMFFVLPAVTLREFSSHNNLPPKLWYFIKCLYLLLSAYQIRSGYPTRILGNFFCKKYNYINLFFFKGYMLVPFLHELRCLMDWMWTDTSMTIGIWLKMEDIYANIFVLKCFRRAEAEYPTPRGAKRTSLVKYGMGGILLFVIILIIWFPLLLFALGNTVGVSNQPSGCNVQLSIGGYEPVFKMGAQQSSIYTFQANDWNKMLEAYKTNPTASDFLANFDSYDVTLIKLSGNSTSIWAISPPSQDALSSELESNKEINMKITFTFFRDAKSSEVDNEISNYNEIPLSNSSREQLANIINKTSHNESSVKIEDIFPKYLRLPGKGKISFVTALNNSDDSAFRSLTLSLRLGSLSSSTSEMEYWEIQENCSDGNEPYRYLNKDCSDLWLIAFNNKVFPSELSVISGYGIVGLYTTFVLVVSRIVRSVIAGSSYTIMFDDMPYVDRVLQLCLDIYLVRESGEFTLEEDLFAKLIFLYRSPETLIRWTRYPELP